MDWKVFFSTFGLIFLAEMGDKTQLMAISLTAESQKPVMVFAGAALALALVTLIGVVFGEGIIRLVPEIYLKRGAAVMFVAIGVWMWFKG